MARKPELIVEELLAGPERDVRLSALSALLKIESEESLSKFVEVGVHGAYEVRSQVLSLLRGLPQGLAARVAAKTIKLLQSPSSQDGAYALLAALRAQGTRIAMPPLSWKVRWKLAGNLRNRSGLLLGIDNSLVRTLLSTIVACVLSTVAVEACLLVNRMYLDSSDFLAVLLLAAAIGTGLALLTARRLVPLFLVPDHAMGIARRLFLTGAVGLSMGTLTALGVLWLASQRSDISLHDMITAAEVALLGTPLMAVGCFLGTHWTAGAARSTIDVWMRAAVGGIAGMLALTLVVAFFNGQAQDFASGFWMYSIPSAVGFSAHLARFDHFWQDRTRSKRFPRLFAGAVVALFAALVLLPRMTLTVPGKGIVSSKPLSQEGVYEAGIWQLPRTGELIVEPGLLDSALYYSNNDSGPEPLTPTFVVALRKGNQEVIRGMQSGGSISLKGWEGEYDYDLRYPGVFFNSADITTFSYDRCRFFWVLRVLAYRIGPDMLKTRFGFGLPNGPPPVLIFIGRA